MSPVPTYQLTIEYDGSAFHGWQIQKNAYTVQEAVEDALATILDEPLTVYGSSRTDAGVHARGQIAHFSRETPIDPYRLRGSLNGVLPPTVAVPKVDQVPDDFHARFDAVARRYHYYVSVEPIAIERNMRRFVRPPKPDFDRMNEAAKDLLGVHSFESFSRSRPTTDHYRCELTRARWIREAPPDCWRFEIEANRFLHGMVRGIVGTLLEIGRTQRPVSCMSEIIEAETREAAGPSVPAHGLILEEVYY